LFASRSTNLEPPLQQNKSEYGATYIFIKVAKMKNSKANPARLGTMIAILPCLMATSAALAQSVPPAQDSEQVPPAKTVSGSDLVLEEIIVTATKRRDAIIDIPQSIQAVSSDTLDRLGAASLQDVINQLPGVSGFSTGTGKSDFNIRGVASFSGSVIDSSTVGFYVDEIPLSNASITPDVTLYDLERVEVLRGPQGTLYGEGSLGGTIKLVTKRPDFDGYAAEVFSELSSTQKGGTSFRGSGVINAPIIGDKIALRLVGTYLSDGGFIDDDTSGRKDVNKAEFYNIRSALRIKPSDTFDIQFGYTRQKGTGGPDPLEAPGLSLALRQAFPQTFKDSFDLFSITSNLSLGGTDLIFASSYFDRKRNEFLDEPSTTFLIENGLGIELPNGTIADTTSPERTWTHEARLVSNGVGPFTWLLGAYYKDRRVGLLSTTVAPDLAAISPDAAELFRTNVDTKFREVAAFGEASYRVTDKLKLTGGARVFRQTYKGTTQTSLLIGIDPDTGAPDIIDTGSVPIRQRTQDVLFKVSIDYKFNKNTLLYALFSQGVRGGGVNTRLFSPDIPRTYNPDSVNNYELGLKIRGLDGRLSINSSIFNLDWKNIQVGVNPQIGINFIANAGGARSRGFETEMSFKPIDAVTLGGGYALIDAKLRTPVEIASATEDTPAIISPEGSRIASVAKHKFNIYGDLQLPLSDTIIGFARADGEYVGSIAATLPQAVGTVIVAPALKLPAYFSGNIRFGLEAEAVTITAYVENLTNKRARLSAIDPEVEGFLINRPRTYGISLRASF
jgi:iron complex outermembrane recepter protein